MKARTLLPALLVAALILEAQAPLLIPAFRAQARVLTVDAAGDGDHTRIQDAVDAAVTGDTVSVLPGRYVETVEMSFDIHLISAAGPAHTIIDGAGAGPVISCLGLSPNSSIQGFTVTGGVARAPVAGGGIYVAFEASPLIRGNIVTGNRSVASGLAHSSFRTPPFRAAPLLCDPVPGDGGGMYVYFNCAPAIVGNVIADNEARGSGGGIAFWDHADAVCEGNRIYRNKAGRNGGGVFIGCNAMPALERNIIAWNEAGLISGAAGSGGGVCIKGLEADATLRRNTLYMNSAAGGAGGVHCEGPCRPVIETNLIGVASGRGIHCDPETGATITCNVIWGAGEAGYSEACFVSATGFFEAGNLIREVALCGPEAGDFRPCDAPYLLTECGVAGAEEDRCDPGPCGYVRGSWGLIKSLYRDP